MSFLDKIIGGGVGSIVKELGDVADKFITTDAEKQAFRLQTEAALTARFAKAEETAQAEINAQRDIIVAELTQGDNYTKRARPTIVYVGLFMAVFNYTLAPFISAMFSKVLPMLVIPAEFWTIWGGVCGLYVWKRSQEKTGAK
jgi:hypothetical protein